MGYIYLSVFILGKTIQCTQNKDTNKDEIQIQKDPRLGKTAPHCVDFVDWSDARQDYNE